MGLGRLSYPNESHLKKKYIYIYISSQMVGLVGSVGSQIVRFYDPDCDFDNHGLGTIIRVLIQKEVWL